MMENGKQMKKAGLLAAAALLVVLLLVFWWLSSRNGEADPTPGTQAGKPPAQTQTQVSEPAGGTEAVPEKDPEATDGNEPAAQPTDGTEPAAQPTDGTEPAAQPTDGTEPAAEPTDGNEPAAQPTDGTEPAEPAISFPASLENGRLEILSTMTYSGVNPDCGNQEGNDVAGIVLKNTSAEYLSEALITLTLSNGTEANFLVTDLPVGRTAMAFSTENAPLFSANCVEIFCESEFDAEASLSEGMVDVQTDGVTVTLTNVSGSDLNHIVVYCHNILDPDYFGGVTYKYNVEHLAAGGSTTVDAWDCILGMAEVVRVDAE